MARTLTASRPSLLFLALLLGCGDVRDHAIVREAGASDGSDSVQRDDVTSDLGALDEVRDSLPDTLDMPFVPDAPSSTDSRVEPLDAGDVPAARKSAGEACRDNGECQSAFCTDGVCCLVSKCDLCRQCGSEGRCTVRIAAGMEDTANACFGRKACDRDGECRAKTDELCANHSECITRYCGIVLESDGSYKRACRECGKLDQQCCALAQPCGPGMVCVQNELLRNDPDSRYLSKCAACGGVSQPMCCPTSYDCLLDPYRRTCESCRL